VISKQGMSLWITKSTFVIHKYWYKIHFLCWY